MAASQYNHDLSQIVIINCIESQEGTGKKTFKLPKGTWQRKLDKVIKKTNEFKMNENITWEMSINNKLIEPNDTKQFEQILSVIPPPINIKIIKRKEEMTSNESTISNQYVNITLIIALYVIAKILCQTGISKKV